MSSTGGLIFGMINIVGNFGTIFCDQGNFRRTKESTNSHVFLFSILAICDCISATKLCEGFHSRRFMLVLVRMKISIHDVEIVFFFFLFFLVLQYSIHARNFSWIELSCIGNKINGGTSWIGFGCSTDSRIIDVN